MPSHQCTQQASVDRLQPDEGHAAGSSPLEEAEQRTLPWGVSVLCQSAALPGQGVGRGDAASDVHATGNYAAKVLAHPQPGSAALLQHVLACLSRKPGAMGNARSASSKGAGCEDVDARIGTCVGEGVTDDRVLLAIGPEGGWRAAEVELLAGEEGGGFTQVSLGDRVLSTTCALVSAIGTIQAAQQLMDAPPGGQGSIGSEQDASGPA